MVSKFRIRFKKAGDLRFLSHHDLMRLFERMLRRAALPFRSSEGFHPKPKMAFASALALGIIGLQEVIEIEFDGEWAEDEVRARLAAQALPGLEILTVRRIEQKAKAHVCRVRYWLQLDRDRSDQIVARLEELGSQSHWWMERSRPQLRRVDIKPYIHRIDVDCCNLEMEFKVTPQGTARPEEVLDLLGLKELLLSGAVIERTALVLEDELAPSSVELPNIEVVTFTGGGGDEEAAEADDDAVETALNDDR